MKLQRKTITKPGAVIKADVITVRYEHVCKDCGIRFSNILEKCEMCAVCTVTTVREETRDGQYEF